MRYVIAAILVVNISIIISGCATTNTEARNLARVTLDATLKYQQSVERKIEAEKDFYKSSDDLFKRDLEKEVVEDVEGVILDKYNDMVKRVAKDKKPLESGQLKSEMVKVVESVKIKIIAKDDKLRTHASMYNSLKELDYQKKLLKEVRIGLEELQKEPNSLRVWYNFSRETYKEYNKIKDNK